MHLAFVIKRPFITVATSTQDVALCLPIVIMGSVIEAVLGGLLLQCMHRASWMCIKSRKTCKIASRQICRTCLANAKLHCQLPGLTSHTFGQGKFGAKLLVCCADARLRNLAPQLKWSVMLCAFSSVYATNSFCIPLAITAGPQI